MAALFTDKVYVALPENYDDGKDILSWVMEHASPNSTVVITHVFKPEQENRFFRGSRKDRVRRRLNNYASKRSGKKIKFEILAWEMDDVAKGRIEIISSFRIRNFVIGAAAGFPYSSDMKGVNSKARDVMQKSEHSCRIWFICNGELICTREPNQGAVESDSSADAMLPWRIKFHGAHSSEVEATDYYGNAADPVQKTRMNEVDTEQDGRLEGNRLEENHEIEMLKIEIEELQVEYSTLQDRKHEYSAPQYQRNTMSVELEHIDLEGTLLAQHVSEIEMLKKDIEDLKKENSALQDLKQKCSALQDFEERYYAVQDQQNAMSEELERAHQYGTKLEQQVAEFERKWKAGVSKFRSTQAENTRLRHELHAAVLEAQELRDQAGKMFTSFFEYNSVFSVDELKEATQNFCNDLKLGEVSFGCVYKGSIRNTPVAIKVLSCPQGKTQFQHVVSILRKVRHPNLVTLIGACPELSSLVYEFLPNGSIEDILDHASNKTSLTWQIRTRVIGEICSALIFLHNNKPHPVIHGDLRPANILLDANFVSKISDSGISLFMVQSVMNASFLHNLQNAVGTIAYMDPEFLNTRVLTPQSDIYAFGITILRLLTGKPPTGIVNLVKDALDNNDLKSVIDSSAGEWPVVQANQLAHIGLRCVDMKAKEHPNLINEVCRVIGPLMKFASLSIQQNNLAGPSEDNIPPYFICPILQEIMRDPHIAADGFTYEAAAIRSWLEMGHDTSPMTNAKLTHKNLIPNHALRSAIRESLPSHA